MALISAVMALGLLAASAGPRRLAIGLALLCLALSAGLFLFEIHSPTDGFAMPWLQVRAGAAPGAAA